MKSVMVMDTEKWRLVMERATNVRTVGFWSRNISSSEDKQESPRKETEKFV